MFGQTWLKSFAPRLPIRARPARNPVNPRHTLLQLEHLETRVTPSNVGTLHLTDSTATVVEKTHYDAKTDVYAYGNFLVDGYYDVEVVAPGGKSGNTDDVLGLSDPNQPVQVSGGHFVLGFPTGLVTPGTVSGPRGHAFNVWDVVYQTGVNGGTPGDQGYDDTDNPGGEYQVVIGQHVANETSDNFTNNVAKSKNFKVEPAQDLQATSLVTNFVLTQPDGSTVNGPSSPTARAVAGSTAQDFATVTVTNNGNPVTEGTVNFQLFGPSGLIDDSDADVVNGTATDPFISAPLGAGSYYYVAAFSDGSDFGESQSDQEPFIIDPASPTLVTTATPNGTLALGTGTQTLSDSAVLSGGYSETGSITFVLKQNGSPVYTNTVTVSGDGTYGSGSYTLPTNVTVTGSYVWTASYTGDGNNNPASDPGTSAQERLTVNPASPTIVTTASPNGTLTLGTTAVTLSDAAVLSGGYFETGSITFVLKQNGNQVYTNTVTVNGNGTYGSGSYTLPTNVTVTGSYVWTASYTGDGNNYAASDPGTSAQEKLTVNPAQPTIITIQGGTVAAGAGQKMTDKADLEGGYYETGTITFKLYAPNGSIVDTESVAVNGNGVYTTPTGYTPSSTAAAGTYYWVASYSSGNGNNTNVAGGRYDEPEVVQNGLTMGYYSNKNGQTDLTGSASGDTVKANIKNALIAALTKPGSTTLSVLVNNAGVYQPLTMFSSYNSIKTFLAGYATATNMANMLSAQLLTLELDVILGRVNATKSIKVSAVTLPSTGLHMSSTLQHSLTVQPAGTTAWTQVTTTDGGAAVIQAIINASIAQLAANPVTVAGNGNRTYQEALKDCIDGINNNEPIFI